MTKKATTASQPDLSEEMRESDSIRIVALEVRQHMISELREILRLFGEKEIDRKEAEQRIEAFRNKHRTH